MAVDLRQRQDPVAGVSGQTVSWREGARRTVAWMDANGRTADESEDGGYEDRLIDAWERAVEALGPVA